MCRTSITPEEIQARRATHPTAGYLVRCCGGEHPLRWAVVDRTSCDFVSFSYTEGEAQHIADRLNDGVPQ